MSFITPFFKFSGFNYHLQVIITAEKIISTLTYNNEGIGWYTINM
jgi:hypothetical protein